MIKRLSLIITIIILGVLKTATAQRTDFRARFGAGIEKEFGNFTAGIEYEHRFDNVLTTFDKALIEPSVSYEVTDFFDVGAQYRIEYDQNIKRERRFEQRISVNARLKYEFDDFEFKYKTILQYGSDDLSNPFYIAGNKLVNRHSFEIEYNWFGLPLVPFAGYEFFIHLNDARGTIINQYRIEAGIDYDMDWASTFTFFYRFENEFNIAYPTDSHTLGLKYRFKF
ncbi:MAG: DUF2490 domain-containing protein [Prolixibacteraceae bacterium]|nr:DUF2490 domain-containing protein [Prolixibacteraceae bacterium]